MRSYVGGGLRSRECVSSYCYYTAAGALLSAPLLYQQLSVFIANAMKHRWVK